jgi:predicted nucleic acid-binding protein
VRLVLDASVTLAWFFENEVTEETERLQLEVADGAQVCCPAHWPAEIVNGLTVAERRHRVLSEKSAQFLNVLSRMRIAIEPFNKDQMPFLLELARKHRLTAYDAGYLDLAIQHAILLATLDSALRIAATKARVLLRPAIVSL